MNDTIGYNFRHTKKDERRIETLQELLGVNTKKDVILLSVIHTLQSIRAVERYDGIIPEDLQTDVVGQSVETDVEVKRVE